VEQAVEGDQGFVVSHAHPGTDVGQTSGNQKLEFGEELEAGVSLELGRM
jgi:hypothetical protein